MNKIQEKWESLRLEAQQFTQQESVAVCFDFCCDAESYSYEDPNNWAIPYLHSVAMEAGLPFNENGDFRDDEKFPGTFHFGLNGINPSAACHGSISSELWGHWNGSLGAARDWQGDGIGWLQINIGGQMYNTNPESLGLKLEGIPFISGTSYQVMFVEGGSYHTGHTTGMTTAS